MGYFDFQSGPEVLVRDAPEGSPVLEIPSRGVDMTLLENVLPNLWMDWYDQPPFRHSPRVDLAHPQESNFIHIEIWEELIVSL